MSDSIPEAIYIQIEGKIDSESANGIEQGIFLQLEKHPNIPIIIDMSKVSYISNAGLQVMMKVKKAREAFKIIKVNNEIYDIFAIAGFTNLMEIKKDL